MNIVNNNITRNGYTVDKQCLCNPKINAQIGYFMSNQLLK